MRIEKTLKNSMVTLILSLLKLVVTFFIRRAFLLELGEEYLGLNALLVNVISLLSLVDLGVGSAVGYSLYTPLADGKKEEISSKINFFRVCYRKVFIVMIVAGILYYPFFRELVKNIKIIDFKIINLAYILFLLDTSTSYLLSYKKILLEADQKNYKINIVNTSSFMIASLLQYFSLIVYRNFILYLIIKIVFNTLSNYICSIIVDKNYPYLIKYKELKLNVKEKTKIMSNIRALLLHKVGDVVINSTDNIIIAKYINISMVGIFSNYMMVVLTLQGIITQTLSSITGSVGNLLTIDNEKKIFEIFKTLNMLGYLIFGLITTVLYINIEFFIDIWLGKDYIIGGFFLIILVVNMYVTGMRCIPGTVKSAAGLYKEDKYSPLIQSGLNLFFSIILVKKIGITGVLLGTLISSFVPTIYRPYILYKVLFKEKYFGYLKDYIKYLFLTSLSIVIAKYLLNFLSHEKNILNLIRNVGISSLVFIIISLIGIFKTKEFDYINKNILKKIGDKLWKKKFL